LERFLAAIAPYDPDPDRPVAVVEVRVGHGRTAFPLTDRAAGALTQLLVRYTDPDDCGRCTRCAARLDASMRCRACGHVDGIFGAAVAGHATGVAQRHADEAPDAE